MGHEPWPCRTEESVGHEPWSCRPEESVGHEPWAFRTEESVGHEPWSFRTGSGVMCAKVQGSKWWPVRLEPLLMGTDPGIRGGRQR